ncbi:MAG: M14 family zinc carboxypeptidase [Lachnospiraceae bacterium]|nr:M14 family zinc carboxypeptidase [Lachnospiraceae bacterium]
MIVLNQRYSYQDIFTSMQILSGCYPEFTVCRIIGTSYDDRAIPMMRVGIGMETLVCTAGIHGRETINPVLLLRMIDEYANAYRTHQTIDGVSVFELLNRYSICFIPLLNPDGYEIALHGFEVIANPLLRKLCRFRKISSESWKYNARGVDINRNFPCKSYIQQQLMEYPASELETKALMRIFQDYETVAYMDFHSRGKIIYYYRQAMPHTYNSHSRHLAKNLQKACGYRLGKKEEEILSNMNGGNSVHFYSELTSNPAITIETVDEEEGFPLNPMQQTESYQQIHALPLTLLSSIALER